MKNIHINRVFYFLFFSTLSCLHYAMHFIVIVLEAYSVFVVVVVFN